MEWFWFGWELLSEKACSLFKLFLFVVGLIDVVVVVVGSVGVFLFFCLAVGV